MLRPLLIAIQFLTRLPVPKGLLKQQDYQAEDLGKSVVMYPVVGLLIGAILVAVVFGLEQFVPQLSRLVLAAIVLCLWVLLTGALHLDGLSDSADAWVGGYGDRDRTLEIMKDPYCGPAGVTVIVVFLLLKFALLSTVSIRAWPTLLLAPVIARAAIPLLFMTTSYVRKDGIGASHASMLPRWPAGVAMTMVLAACFYLLHLQALWMLLAVAMVFISLRYMMVQRLGGTTGDTAGALIEVLEVVVLFVMVKS